MTPGLAVGLVSMCLVSEAFFSGSETAVTSADRLRLKTQADEGSRGAALALSMLEQRTDLLGTCLIGTNTSTVSASTVATAALASAWPDMGEALAVACLFPVILTFGELLPKTVFREYADQLAPVLVFPIRFFSLLFKPALLLINLFTTVLGRVTGTDGGQRPVSRQEIQALIENQEDVELDPEDRELIQRVFDFTEARVEDVMKPLIEVVSVSEEASPRDAIALMVAHGYSRLPLYRGRVDQVTGLIYHNDLLFLQDLDAPLTEICRPVSFVPESKSVEELFTEFRRERQRIAVPVDEYGGAVGLITMEDILEEIVGEIDDEYDERLKAVRMLADDLWMVNARVEAEVLLAATGFEQPEGDYETLAGYLLSRLGRVPEVGEQLREGAWTLEVSKASDRAILEVRLRRRGGA